MRILLGITGGIAAYKAANLIRAFSEAGHDVTVLPTENALRFIGQPTLEALSGHNIDIDMYSDVEKVRHVALGQQADAIVVAPATAAFLGRLAAGIADDLLMNAILASEAPIFLAPAMHTEMWQNPATRANIQTLEERGIRIMAPASGRLTGGDSGPGRLPEVEEIFNFVLSAGALRGKKVIVTAGGTREPIDAVRYIGNSSSGRMGIEIAKAARDMGADVTLIAANIESALPAGVKVERVSTVDDLEIAMDHPSDILVMAAAVSDFKVENPYPGKLKRSGSMELSLTATKDLIAAYSANHADAYCVGFALADSDADLEQVARQKLWDKGLKLVVGNRVSALGAKDTSVLLVQNEKSEELTGTKQEVAKALVAFISQTVSH
ncbi:MAG TPA: bifunctional phosphopantothenoylcysteine decarboxylase/phosphopantothenate--cysteine ligase CoaBC [Aquiluna sp.]